MKPNIFNIATKELSQDAFFTWLFKWGNPKLKTIDSSLNKCSIQLIKYILNSQKVPINEIFKIEAGRQWNNIDIWINVNQKYRIIIEDKTYTTQHSNQLLRYKEFAQKWCENNNKKLICVYLKTGNESSTSQNDILKKAIIF